MYHREGKYIQDLGGGLKERDNLEKLGPHARTVLMWILNKYDRRDWMR